MEVQGSDGGWVLRGRGGVAWSLMEEIEVGMCSGERWKHVEVQGGDGGWVLQGRGEVA